MSLARLQAAAETGALFLAFQPKLDLRSGGIAGLEALARWHDPQLGIVEPSSFIRAAEDAGLIDWFTEWALTAAFREWAAWEKAGVELEMAVNISALNLEHETFPDLVSRLCATEGVDRSRLLLELAETSTQDTSRLADTIARFRMKGIGLSLDDFGIGYASLVQLRSMPFSELKLDRRFVGDLLHSRDSRAIVRGLVVMAHELGLEVTAEGVEDYETLEALTLLGCDKAQGYFIAAPMRAEAIAPWIAKRASIFVRAPAARAPEPRQPRSRRG